MLNLAFSMSIAEQLNEIGRLITVFESEAARFHPLTLKTLTFRRIETLKLQKLASPHHAVMLWQHYGEIGGKAEADRFQANLESSDLKWGLNGAELMQFAVLEGEHIGLFVRMAERGGSLFDANEASLLKMRVLTELQRSRTKDSTKKFVGVVNDAPLAIWLNFLLFHLSLVSPGRERVKLIHPDPFSLSLLALERLREVGALTKSDRTDTRIDDITFDVALSFAGEQRVYVAEVAGVLRSKLGPNKVFYDFDYQAQLARPNLDVLLQGDLPSPGNAGRRVLV